MYVKKMYDSVERTDQNIQKSDFESTWVEVKNKKRKKIVCACIYRNPCSNLEEFRSIWKNVLKYYRVRTRSIYAETLILIY